MIQSNALNVKAALKAGKVICMPTDTLYALACDATNDEAVARIYSLKKREIDKALPIFTKSLADACDYAIFNEMAIQLAKAFWPGPLTLVLPARAETRLSKLIHSSSDNRAIRVPNNGFINELLNLVDFPIATTSANFSNQENLFSVEEIRNQFGDLVAVYVDDDSNSISKVASTIIDCTSSKPRFIRNGAITEADIKKIV